MIYLPLGLRLGEVVDPTLLSREYQNALRIVNHTTHYQWGENAITQYQDQVELSHDWTSVELGGSGDSGQAGDVVQIKA